MNGSNLESSYPTIKSGATAIFFDSRCLLHQANYRHVEGPYRVLRSYEKLVNTGLWNRCLHLQLQGMSMLDEIDSLNNKLVYGSNVPGQSYVVHDPQEISHDNIFMNCERSEDFDNSAKEGVIVDYLDHPMSSSQDNVPLDTYSLPQFTQYLRASLSESPIFSPLYPSPPAPFSRSQLLALDIHTPSHLASIVSHSLTHSFGEDELDSETEDDPIEYPDCLFLNEDAFLNRYSYASATVAASGVVQLTDAVCEGRVQNAFALIRPPGHHASQESMQGFCLYNNVALAAKHALTHFSPPHFNSNSTNTTNFDGGVDNFTVDSFSPSSLLSPACGVHEVRQVRRVLIVDYDVHHGNGTQNCFYSSDEVLCISIHRYSPGFFPESGLSVETGRGKGRGYTVNIPVPANVGDLEYYAAWCAVVLPIAHTFKPDLVLVSAGFDCLKGDPLGGLSLTPVATYHLTKSLMYFSLDSPHNITSGQMDIDKVDSNSNSNSNFTNVCQQVVSRDMAPVVAVLEGGYNPDVVAEGVHAVVSALLGDDYGYSDKLYDLSSNNLSSDYRKACVDKFYKYLNSTIDELSVFWPFLKSSVRNINYATLNSFEMFSLFQDCIHNHGEPSEKWSDMTKLRETPVFNIQSDIDDFNWFENY